MEELAERDREKVNLLLLDDSLGVGGKEILLLDYLKGLDRCQFNVHLVTLTDLGELLPQAQELADEYGLMGRRYGWDGRALWRLRKYLWEHAIDILHANGWIDSLYALLASQGLPLKRIVSVHGYESGWRRPLHRGALRHYDGVVCVSESSRLELLQQGYSARRLEVLYNCFDATRFKPQRKEPNPGHPFQIAMTGRFDPRKDQATLCRAVAALHQQGQPVHLDLIGGGNSLLEEACKALCQNLGAEKVIRFVGPTNAVPQFLQEADCFIFSSRSETFGIALVEAMACGLPVIVSDIPACMEIIEQGKSGLFFRAGDAPDLAAQIQLLMEDRELRQQLGERALARAQDFTPEKSVASLEGLYRSLWEEGRPAMGASADRRREAGNSKIP